MSALDWNRINRTLERHPVLPLTGLALEHRTAAEAATIIHARRLEQLGVSRSTLADFRRDHWGWGIVNAVEHPSQEGLYCLDPAGVPHLLLPVYERGELIDLVAFRSSKPEEWLFRKGLGWALGLERGLDAHTWQDGPVHLVASPLDWLRGGCQGLCVLDWGAGEVQQLRDIPHLACSTPELATLLRSALSRPVRLPNISIMEARLAAA